MRIVCVHQGYELYGSDRCFIDSVAALREAWPQADIEVVLPREGPIAAPLRALATRVIIEPLFILRRRGLARSCIATAPFRLAAGALARGPPHARGRSRLCQHRVVRRTICSRRASSPRKRWCTSTKFPTASSSRCSARLLSWTRAEAIFNSKATRAAYALPPARTQHVLYNGIAAPPDAAPQRLRRHAPAAPADARPHQPHQGTGPADRGAGRAAEGRSRAGSTCASSATTFENDIAREQALHAAVRDAGLESVVRFEPFQRRSGAALSLGRYRRRCRRACRRRSAASRSRRWRIGRPPLVARIGGLPEIVEDGVSGWIVPPNDAQALARTHRRDRDPARKPGAATARPRARASRRCSPRRRSPASSRRSSARASTRGQRPARATRDLARV